MILKDRVLGMVSKSRLERVLGDSFKSYEKHPTEKKEPSVTFGDHQDGATTEERSGVCVG